MTAAAMRVIQALQERQAVLDLLQQRVADPATGKR